MTKISQTRSKDIDEAHAFAVKTFRAAQDRPHSLFSAFQAAALRKDLMAASAISRIRDNPQEIIDAAKRNSDQYDCLRFGILSELKMGETLAKPIVDWLIERELGNIEIPVRRDGRQRHFDRVSYSPMFGQISA